MWGKQKKNNFHSRNAEIDNKEFQKRMRAIRTGDYLVGIDNVRKGLNFKGKMSDVEMEILFIRTAEKKFSKDDSIKKGIKRDIFLMAIGLLKGFGQCKNIEERRLKFLQESNYIAVYKKGKYASCRENKITESIIENMVKDLRKAEDQVIAEIANKLYAQNDCNEYSASISKYYECEHKHKKRIPDSELPSLRHPGSNATSTPKGTGNEEKTCSEKEHTIREKLKRYISFVLSLISALASFYTVLPIFIAIGQLNTPEIKKIHVFNDQITLQPGQSEKIEVAWYPNNADKDDLSCISDDPTIATVEDLIVTAKKWQKGRDTTKVSIGGGDAEKVEVDISVNQSDHDDKPGRNKVTGNNSPDSGTGMRE